MEDIKLTDEVKKIIKTTSVETGAYMVEKIGSALADDILEKIQPLQESKIQVLEDEVEKLRNDIYYLNQVVNTIENKNTYCLRVVKKSKIHVQNILMEGIKRDGNKQQSK